MRIFSFQTLNSEKKQHQSKVSNSNELKKEQRTLFFQLNIGIFKEQKTSIGF